MKKIFSLLAVLALVSMVSSVVWAATEQSFGAKEAYAEFSATALTFNVTLYNWTASKNYDTGYTSSDVAENISFVPGSGFVFGTSDLQKVVSNVIAKIQSNIRQQPAGTTVYVYTDNTHNSTDYKANAKKDWEGVDGDYYGGIVRKGNTSKYVEGDIADLYMIVRSTTEATTEYFTAKPDFSNVSAGVGGKTVIDISDSKYATYSDADKVIAKSGTGGGIWHWSENGVNTYTDNQDAIVFFGVGFRNVFAGDKFGTTTISFKAVTE